MAKYKRSKQELQEQWDAQVRFIQKSVKEFDAGDESEARRIAASLRILFHETKQSKSLFKQLGLPLTFYSSGYLYTLSNLLSSLFLTICIFCLLYQLSAFQTFYLLAFVCSSNLAEKGLAK